MSIVDVKKLSWTSWLTRKVIIIIENVRKNLDVIIIVDNIRENRLIGHVRNRDYSKVIKAVMQMKW